MAKIRQLCWWHLRGTRDRLSGGGGVSDEDLDLPLLDLPWEPGDLAEGFELTDMVRGYRTLERAGGGPR